MDTQSSWETSAASWAEFQNKSFKTQLETEGRETTEEFDDSRSR